MKRIRYFINRILIGVGIALVLSFLRGNLVLGVRAREMSTSSFGGLQVAVNGTDNNYIWDVTDGSWENWGSGVLIGNGSIIKTNGQSTSSFATVRSVMAYSGNQAYVCKMGSTASNNSTYQNQTFTFECPMIMGQYGLQQIAFIYSHTGGTDFTMRLEVNGSLTFVKDEVDGSSGTTSAINNQITNDNTNTTNIINNNNQNTQDIIESNQVCTVYDLTQATIVGNFNNTGTIVFSATSWRSSDFIKISSNDKITTISVLSSNPRYCFYNTNKSFISCGIPTSSNESITIPSNASYFRYSVSYGYNMPTYKLCRNGNQALADSQQEINNTLNNDDVTGATSTAESFFDDFQSDSHGLSGIITAPLRLIQSLSSSTCSPLSIPLPFVNTNATLPCMSGIYSTYFPTFLTLYQLITTGLIGYWVLIKLFGHVKGMQDPHDDRIEVLDL